MYFAYDQTDMICQLLNSRSQGHIHQCLVYFCTCILLIVVFDALAEKVSQSDISV